MIEQINDVRTTDAIYPAIVTNKTKGWVGSGFQHRYTEMKVRRIPSLKGSPDTKEHVQIEIGIDTVKGKDSRLYSVSGELYAYSGASLSTGRSASNAGDILTLIVPTAYRRNFLRERQEKLVAAAGDAQEVPLKCMRCFQTATVGLRCDACREKRTMDNKTRKR